MQLTDEQFNLIKEQFKTLKDRSPFYAKKFEDIDLSDVQTQADFAKLAKFLFCKFKELFFNLLLIRFIAEKH